MTLDQLTLSRQPLITKDGLAMLRRLREHPDSPRFNYATGDRLRREDLPIIAAYREALATRRRPCLGLTPPPAILAEVCANRHRVPLLRRSLARFDDIEAQWQELPTTSRSDLALAPWDFVPDDADLSRMVIYRTAGTTGHPIVVPHHPVAVRLYEPLIEHALLRHGRKLEAGPGMVACFLVGAQIRTYTYAAVLANWGQAGFAKLNLRQTEWRAEGSQRRYFEAFCPALLTGDPISFAEMLRLDLKARPSALVTTSVAMSPTLRERLSARYEAPVIDWYSLVETGPIGYRCPMSDAYHVLPPDIFVEVLRQDGSACAAGERGEVTVTGGRNPLAPLVRYRTGDFGCLDPSPCVCGDPTKRLVGLEGRAPVLLRSSDGTPVSTVDISRLLREHPLLLHELVQRADKTVELRLRAVPGTHPRLADIEADLRRVLGDVRLDVAFDETLGERLEGKVNAYRSELFVED